MIIDVLKCSVVVSYFLEECLHVDDISCQMLKTHLPLKVRLYSVSMYFFPAGSSRRSFSSGFTDDVDS